MTKPKIKTKDQIVVMLKGVEQRRKSFLHELGESYIPIVDFDKLNSLSKNDLLKLGEQAIGDVSQLTNRVIERREQTEIVVDEVNQLTASIEEEDRQQPTMPPISMKRPMNERAMGAELHEVKENVLHLLRENALLQGQVALLNGIIEQMFNTLSTNMSDEQKKECVGTIFTLVEKMAAK